MIGRLGAFVYLAVLPGAAVAGPAQIITQRHWDPANPPPVVHATLNAIALSSPLASLETKDGDLIFYAYIDEAGHIAVRRIAEKRVNGTVERSVSESLLRQASGELVVVSNDPFHVAPSLGIDEAGYVHVAGNMHNQSWQYWVSAAPASVAGFRFLGMPLDSRDGAPHADASGNLISPPGYRITYPYFANDRAGHLYVAFRHTVGRDLTTGPTAQIDYPGEGYQGTMGGGIAEYQVKTARWRLIGGTRYELPGDTTPLVGKRLLPTTLYQPDGRVGAPQPEWYQSYNIHLWFDAGDIMHVTTQLYTSGRVEPEIAGPTRIVYARGLPDGADGDGFVHYRFVNVGHEQTKAPDGDVLSLENGNLSVVYSRRDGEALSTQSYVGLAPARGAAERPIVQLGWRGAGDGGSIARWFVEDGNADDVWRELTIRSSPKNYLLSPHLGPFLPQHAVLVSGITSATNGRLIWTDLENHAAREFGGFATRQIKVDYRYASARQDRDEPSIRFVGIDAAHTARIYTVAEVN